MSAREWLHDDLTALELFEVAAEYPEVRELIQEWLDVDDYRDRTALFVEIVERVEEIIVEVEVDF